MSSRKPTSRLTCQTHMPTRRIPSVLFRIFANAKVGPNGRRYSPIRTRTSRVYYARESLLQREDGREDVLRLLWPTARVSLRSDTHDLPARHWLLFSRNVLLDFGQEQKTTLRSGLRAASMRARRDGLRELYDPYCRIFRALPRRGVIETLGKKNAVKRDSPSLQMRSS